MVDNFNFKSFLFENKLGAYSKAENVNETQDNMIIATPANSENPQIEFQLVGRPSPGAKSFIAQYDGWKEASLDVVSDSELEKGNVRIKGSWYNVSGRGLDKLKSQLARLGYKGAGETRVIVPKESTEQESEMKEISVDEPLNQAEVKVDSRLMQTALDAISDVLEDLQEKNVSYEDALAYLQMKMEEYLGLANKMK